MLVPPKNIRPYTHFDFSLEACLSGTVVKASPNLPEELKEEFEEFANGINKIAKENPFKEW
ncbi:MAG: hypothetical protein IJZ64_05160 [Ruminococcus sp.]|nr:hypothetical protein [Ruminococcus sp.]